MESSSNTMKHSSQKCMNRSIIVTLFPLPATQICFMASFSSLSSVIYNLSLEMRTMNLRRRWDSLGPLSAIMKAFWSCIEPILFNWCIQLKVLADIGEYRGYTYLITLYHYQLQVRHCEPVFIRFLEISSIFYNFELI